MKQDQDEFVNDAPVPHMAIPDSLVSSPLSPALNPSFDEQMIQDVMPPPDQQEEAEKTEESPSTSTPNTP